jgi:hypothetical protein
VFVASGLGTGESGIEGDEVAAAEHAARGITTNVISQGFIIDTSKLSREPIK